MPRYRQRVKASLFRPLRGTQSLIPLRVAPTLACQLPDGNGWPEFEHPGSRVLGRGIECDFEPKLAVTPPDLDRNLVTGFAFPQSDVKVL